MIDDNGWRCQRFWHGLVRGVFFMGWWSVCLVGWGQKLEL